MRWTAIASVMLVIPAPGWGREREDEGAYWALFADGKEATGSRIRDWHYRERKATLSGRRLFDPGNPVRLLCHTGRRPGGRGPRVFLANGDVLPGRVVSFEPAEPAENLPARLGVVPASPLAAGREERGDEAKSRVGVIYVRADAVGAVVFGHGAPRAVRGAAVFFADGRASMVSSVRWTREGLKALAAEQIVSGRFQELSEVHLPDVRRCEAVLADAMVPGGGTGDRLARMETEGGAVLTYRLAMRESRSTRRRGRYDTYHAIQPIWSLTPIHVPEGCVCVRGYRKPTEVPVSLMPAETLAERSFTGFVWPWRRNRSVRGDVLRCGSFFGDMGFGTHSYSAVAFDLPPGARTFSCYVGLDRSVGSGGCTRCAIHRDAPTGKQLWRSGVLIGSDQPGRVGPIAVDKARRLAFVTDFAHDNRPRGADPGDIRDEVNWLMPMVTVDPGVLRLGPEAARRYFPVLTGWSLSGPDLAALKLSMVGLSRRPWELAMDIDKGLTLTRKVKVSLAGAFLEVGAARSTGESGQIIEVEVDGKPFKGFHGNGEGVTTRSRGPGDTMEQRWLLTPLLDREITLAVKVLPDKTRKDTKGLLWRRLAFLPLIANLPPDGQVPAPDVALTGLEPAEVVWFPARKGKRGERTKLPEPGLHKMHGLALANAYAITQGMQMTYKVEPSYRRFVAVVGSESPYHRGPFIVLLDDKEAWRSGEPLAKGQLEQVIVAIPRGTKKISLVPEHNMTTGVWAQAGFLRR